MEKKMDMRWRLGGIWGFTEPNLSYYIGETIVLYMPIIITRFRWNGSLAYLCSAGNERMEKKAKSSIFGYIGITIRIHSFISR